jgi:hypothetical protein
MITGTRAATAKPATLLVSVHLFIVPCSGAKFLNHLGSSTK